MPSKLSYSGSPPTPAPTADRDVRAPAGSPPVIAAPDLSIVIPVYNEEQCVAATVEEIFPTLDGLGLAFEVIVVDDGSTDGTPAILAALRARERRVRVLRLHPNSGQSAALGAGFQAARGRVVVMMDGDGQNCPGDIPRLLDGLGDCDVCCGYRQDRRDTWGRRVGGRLANAVRRAWLRDDIIDTGCSLRAMRADLARRLPLDLKGMHRFIPALLRLEGATVRQMPVQHRARRAGRSKYTNLGRLRETVRDLAAVRWMQARHRAYVATEAP